MKAASFLTTGTRRCHSTISMTLITQSSQRLSSLKWWIIDPASSREGDQRVFSRHLHYQCFSTGRSKTNKSVSRAKGFSGETSLGNGELDSCVIFFLFLFYLQGFLASFTYSFILSLLTGCLRHSKTLSVKKCSSELNSPCFYSSVCVSGGDYTMTKEIRTVGSCYILGTQASGMENDEIYCFQ